MCVLPGKLDREGGTGHRNHGPFGRLKIFLPNGPWFHCPRIGQPERMADSSEASQDTEAELRISRVKALSDKDLVGVVTYLLARHPDTFPPMLDDALSTVSPKDRG
jgi:hypothetical protein